MEIIMANESLYESEDDDFVELSMDDLMMDQHQRTLYKMIFIIQIIQIYTGCFNKISFF